MREVNNIKGPKAPKDPEKNNGYFYIMRDKDIFGGIQYIYENDNRLIESARITGNVADEEMLLLLKTTQGFRKLVKAIGVSVTDNGSLAIHEKVKFVFQMYGKTDPYSSGTSIERVLVADGAEEVIKFDEVSWKDDDFEPGQIRFEFAGDGVLAQATVRLYLNEGFTPPPIPEVDNVDVNSDVYKAMIARSLLQIGDISAFERAIDKAKSGKDVTVAFIGGSITQGAGAIPINHKCYAYLTYVAFKERYGNGDNVHFIKAGVGGTPSELGMIRFERDVLRDNSVMPDIIVVEFAVNDDGDETKGKCYESLVRKCLKLPNNPAVILLFSVFSNDWNLEDRLVPIGRRYNLPMVSVKASVSPQFMLKKEEGRVISKSEYFYDRYHPGNIGHRIMSDCLVNLFDEISNLRKPIIGSEYEDIRLLDKKDGYGGVVYIKTGSFHSTDCDLQSVEMDENLTGTKQFPYNWYKEPDSENEPFEIRIKSRALFIIIKDSGSPIFGAADIYLDDKYLITVNPKDNGWTHCNTVLLYDEEESMEHTVIVKMAKGDCQRAFTILGFGYVE